MSLFGTIMSKIFSHAESAPAAAPATAPAADAPAPAAAATATATPASAPAAPVDVAAILTGLAAKHTEKLDWQHSIVDLMKLLDMDSSFSARKELAGELHFPGDTGDSASMNIWLHKQVMTKLAENGGKVPDELKH